jgi:signal transduction histidine kinase
MMVASAPHTSDVVAVMPKGAPAWFHSLADYCGFSAAPGVRAVLRRASRNELPACVIGVPTVRVLTLFQSLRDSMDLPRRPLLVLLSQYPAPVTVADYVWAPDPVTLRHNLESALSIREQWRQALRRAEEADRQPRAQTAPAQELELLKTTIVRTVAHELRTPMMQVKSAVAMLTEMDDPDKLQELLTYATASTARLDGILGNLILLAEAFKDMDFETVYLLDSLELATRNLRRSWAYRNHVDRVRAVHNGPVPPVHGNRKAISIVLQLLLDNALKFSEDVVDVEFVSGEAHVQVVVRDRGIGIEPQHHDRIFDSFYQMDGTPTRKYGGMGVGLAIARQIVEAHGGRILVHSAPREGSEFLFSLPRAVE